MPEYTGVGSALEVDGGGGHSTPEEVDEDDHSLVGEQQPKDHEPCCRQLPRALLVFLGLYSLCFSAASYGGTSKADSLMKQQLITNNSSSVTTVEFASRFYMEHNKPYPAILFSIDQLQVLGAPQFQRSIIASMISIPCAVIGCFGMVIPILQSNPDNGCYDSSSLARNTLILLLFQWIGCALATTSYVILYQSAICGPYYVELTYERQPGGGYQQGGDAILHQDVEATCEYGDNFYLSLLGTLMISYAVCVTASNWYHRNR